MKRRQQGVVAIVYAMMLVVILGFAALAVDLVWLLQRQAQLQQAADGLALAAARQLDGTASGVDNARSVATLLATSHQLSGVGALYLNDAALGFSSTPQAGSWLSYSAARAAPANLRYARIDTRQLDAQYGRPLRIFGGVLGTALAAGTVSAQAVAGPRALAVLPLAVCAMGAASAVRAHAGGLNELVEYGFRHGVGYNLLNLNPAAGASSGEFFLLDPFTAPGGGAGAPSHTDDANLAPFICNGRVPLPQLGGGAVALRRPAAFTLWQQLNSRFGSYGGSHPCTAAAAPPDTNVRAYSGAAASWMSTPPARQTALPSTPAAGQPLQTVADAPVPLPAGAASRYGVLWAYTAARRSPSGKLSPASWGTLYPAAPALSAAGWPLSVAPYLNAAYSSAPAGTGRPLRRLLRVPLLACPVAPGSYPQASVLAIASFLLTAPASATEVPAEFGGIVDEAALAADVELVQ